MDWQYARIIGQLSSSKKSTRPYLANAVHQYSRFTNDPKELHNKTLL